MPELPNKRGQPLTRGQFPEEQTMATGFPDRYSPIPPNGRHCPFTGLGHSRLYQLLKGPAKPYVRVASLREPRATRGTTLFHVGDMLGYLDSLAAQRSTKGSDDTEQPALEARATTKSLPGTVTPG